MRQAIDRQRTAALTVQKHWRSARLRQLFHADVARVVLVQAAMRRSVCILHASEQLAKLAYKTCRIVGLAHSLRKNASSVRFDLVATSLEESMCGQILNIIF